MDDRNIKFWQVVKKKLLPILEISVLLTFIVVKVIDFILNWYLNKQIAAYSIATYSYTISFLSPVFFIIIFLMVTNAMKRQMRKAVQKPKKIRTKYDRGYTWKDIFKDRVSFGLFLIITFINVVLLYYGVNWISGLSVNYAITSFAYISTDILLVIAVIGAVYIVVFLQNIIIPWFMDNVVAWFINTEKGNKLLGMFVLAFGILTAGFMCGVNYIWTRTEEVGTSMAEDFWLGAIIPFDITTMLFGLITLLFAKIAWPYAVSERRNILIGAGIAIISIIISCTPLQTVIQMMVVFVIHGANI